MQIWQLLLMYVSIILLFFFLINFRWFIRTIRDIAHPNNRGGYTKLIQIGLISVLISIFIGIVIYYIFTPIKVDRMDIILTVVVGWLGAIMSSFFGDKAMESLEEARKNNVEKLTNKYEKSVLLVDKYKQYLENHLLKKK